MALNEVPGVRGKATGAHLGPEPRGGICEPATQGNSKKNKEEMLLRKPEELSHWRGIRHAPSKAPEVYCQLNLRKNSFPTKYVSNCVLWTASIQGVGVRWGKEGKDSK